MKIEIRKIYTFFPPALQTAEHDRHIIKEFIQYQILDFLSTSKYAPKLCFIGGTSLRLVYGIDRFSEDLDFDCKNLSKEDFIRMTNSLVNFLIKTGYKVETQDKPNNERLTAYRRNIVFPSFLYDNGLSPFKEEKFLIKIESQDQGFNYKPEVVNIKGTGLFFNFSLPPAAVLCAMKLAALFDRRKGRDFYDAMFLLSMTEPDYNFLDYRKGIADFLTLKNSLLTLTDNVNLKVKSKDFEHLLFNKENSKKILLFRDFIQQLKPVNK